MHRTLHRATWSRLRSSPLFYGDNARLSGYQRTVVVVWPDAARSSALRHGEMLVTL